MSHKKIISEYKQINENMNSGIVYTGQPGYKYVHGEEKVMKIRYDNIIKVYALFEEEKAKPKREKYIYTKEDDLSILKYFKEFNKDFEKFKKKKIENPSKYVCINELL